MYAQSKRSAYPQPTKQQGKRSRNPVKNDRKSKTILYRLRKICKRYNWARIGAAFLILGAATFTVWGASHLLNRGSDTEAAAETRSAEAVTEPEGYIFKYGEGYAVDMEQLTAAWASEAGFEKRYELTDDERLEIAQVLTAEADGEPFAGKVAVAQCILQTCEDTDMRPHEVLSMYSYSKRRPDPSDEALEAVAAVFDFGYNRLTQEQLNSLAEHDRLGAAAFILVSVELQDFYRVPWGVWRDMRKLYGHKHMNKAELEPFRVQYIAGVLKLLEGIELEYGEQEETL